MPLTATPSRSWRFSEANAMANDQHKGYAVGYAKPPRHSRFQEGGSGNPRGRARGALNLSSKLI